MNQAVDIPGNKEGVHDVLCRLMKTVTLLQELNLNDWQWEDILPKSAVPLLVATARQAYRDGCIAHVTIGLAVDQQIEFIMSSALLMLHQRGVRAAVSAWRMKFLIM